MKRSLPQFIKTPINHRKSRVRVAHKLMKDMRREANIQIIKNVWAGLKSAIIRLSSVQGKLTSIALPKRTAIFNYKPIIPKFRDYKVGWKDVIIAFLLGIILATSHTGHALPIKEGGVTIKTIPKAKSITAPPVTPQSQVAPVQPPAPAPAPITNSDCTTYFSGDVYLDNIIRHESGGNSCATNYLGCFGLLQACPGYPLRVACGGNPACQIQWFIDNKTGGRSWAEVWNHELVYGWW